MLSKLLKKLGYTKTSEIPPQLPPPPARVETKVETKIEKVYETKYKLVGPRQLPKTVTELRKKQLKELEDVLANIPNNAQGGGAAVIIDLKKKRAIELVNFRSKQEALELLERAKKGDIKIVF